MLVTYAWRRVGLAKMMQGYELDVRRGGQAELHPVGPESEETGEALPATRRAGGVFPEICDIA